MTSTTGGRSFETRVRVRGYELDAFGHVNHAVYLNYLEHARFEALEEGGFSLTRLGERGWGVHVVRVEVEYRREAFLGQELLVRTRAESGRSSSMTLAQVVCDPRDPDAVFARARVVAVWIGPDRRPMRIPPEVRSALGL